MANIKDNIFSHPLERPIGMRHVIAFLLFLATTVSYATRVSMSLGIVAMTNPNDYGHPVFEWERSIQDTILSSFFWGYIMLQIPAGILAGKFGGKFLAFGAMTCTGVINLLVPLAAVHVSYQASNQSKLGRYNRQDIILYILFYSYTFIIFIFLNLYDLYVHTRRFFLRTDIHKEYI
ncbi:unnamed protein product [Diatraea saccharalis]|uniref:Inorganic phosphate cotransporter n=1 Tax=Diatraea saccharalis TaxID=40085 RepID=A0A9N9QZT6_9NEOP|nr:unnamed protein product [Diatraea saccharalis]